MDFQVAWPRLLRIGGGVSGELAQLMGSLGLRSPLIVTDAYLAGTGRVDSMVGALSAADIGAAVFADTVPEPTASSIDRGIAALKAGRHDCVVGFGGGSPIDSAKAIAVVGTLGGECRDYRAPHLQDHPGLPIIAIPTTAGTGSEATRFTVVTDDATDEKMLCSGLAFLPIAALVDFELTLTMPPRLTADTGVDALTHAIEAYVSKRANVVSDVFAREAMSAIPSNLRRVWADPLDRDAREAMMTASMQAGIAFSNASVALVHGMSRPIGAHFHVPHGLSNAMLLPAVTRFSVAAARGRYANCARFMGAADAADGDDAATDKLLHALFDLNAELSVPTPAAFGIERGRWRELVPTMARQALASGSPGNNPRVPTVEEIEELYKEIGPA